MKKSKKVTQKTLLLRCYKALLYSRDYVSCLGSPPDVAEFDEAINEILNGRKAKGEAEMEFFASWIKGMP